MTAVPNDMGHEKAGRKILGPQARGMSREDVYKQLLEDGYLRVVNGPPLAIECKNIKEQIGQVMTATENMPPDAPMILDVWNEQVWPENADIGTIGLFRTEFAPAVTGYDILGRGGPSSPWSSKGEGFSVYESKKCHRPYTTTRARKTGA